MHVFCLSKWQVPVNPLQSVDKMQLGNKYTELKGLKEESVLIEKEEGVLIEGPEEIYSSWRFMGLQRVCFRAIIFQNNSTVDLM